MKQLNKLWPSTAIVSVITAVLMVLLTYLQQKINMHHMFNSDALYLPVLYRDLFEYGGSLEKWFLTPAPYFMPDWPIYFTLNKLLLQPYYAIAGFFVVQVILSFTLLVLINKKFTTTQCALAASACSTIFLCLLSVKQIAPFHLMLVSAHHYGVFLMTLLSLFLLIGGLQERSAASETKWAIAVFLTVFIVVLSDMLFVAQFSFPAMIALLYVWNTSTISRRSFLVFSLAIIVGSLVGLVMYKVVVSNPMRPPVVISTESLLKNVQDLIYIVKGIAINGTFAFIILIFFYVFLAVLLAYDYRIESIKYRASRELKLLVAFSLSGLIFIVLLELLTSNMPVTARYLIPTFFIPIAFGPAVIYGHLGNRQMRIVSFALAATLLISIYQLGVIAFKDYSGIKTAYYPEEIACIDTALVEHDLKNGVAGYWDAKQISLLSKHQPHIAQVTNTLGDFLWITSKDYFRQLYDFAVISSDAASPHGLDENLIMQLNGQSENVLQCGKKRLLIYANKKLTTRPWVRLHSSVTWQACKLPSQVGKASDHCHMEAEGNPGYLTFGPYISMDSGDYEFEIIYSSSSSVDQIIGTWDIVIVLPQEAKVILNGDIKGTKSMAGIIKGQFSIVKSFDNERIEIRNYYNGQGELSIAGIKITRIN